MTKHIMGTRIHDMRKGNNLSLEELGKKLGVGKGTISRWEHGEVENIKRSLIAEMSKIFGCDPVWLMGLEDAPEVQIEYTANGYEPLKLKVDHQPIIGKSAEMAKRSELYQAALEVRPENIDVAIKILKSLA
ncbi:MAG: helix-turn-helix domain-containing protein [Lachnospiraceae bacterium]|nr:helix-turn-helix domain-containing protein [Lachnospiraceae bacterium]